MTARVPDRPLVPAIGALVLSLAFVAVLAVRAEGDLSLLVHAGPPWTDPATALDSLTVQPPEDAFDGQFFYRLGVDPLSGQEEVAGVTFDLPSVRWARWGYGALAFGASGGQASLVPLALVAINVAAATALGAIGGALARAAGRHAAWGALFVLWPGFAYSISLDTAELVSSTFALGGLLAAHHRRWAAAAALLVAGLLCRDTAVVHAGGLAVAGALGWRASRQRDTWPGALLAGAVGLAVYVGWQLVALVRFDDLPAASSGGLNLSLPFVDLARELRASTPPDGGDEAFRLLSLVALLGMLVVAAVCWWRVLPRVRRRLAGEPGGPLLPAVWAAWVPAAVVVTLFTSFVWSGATSFMRTSAELAMLSLLLLLHVAPARLLGLVLAGSAGLWVLTAGAQVAKLG